MRRSKASFFILAFLFGVWQGRPSYSSEADPGSGWSLLYAKTHELYQKGRIEEAKKTAEAALIAAEREFGPDHVNTAKSLNDLAAICRRSGEKEKAADLDARAYRIWEKKLSSNDPNLPALAARVGEQYAKLGRFDKAEFFYRKALEALTRIHGPESVKLVEPLIALGSVSEKAGEPDRAAGYYQRAVSLLDRTYGPLYPGTAEALAALGRIYEKQLKWEEAEKAYSRALEIKEASRRSGHLETAAAKEALARVMMERGKYNAAEKLFMEALETAEARAGRESLIAGIYTGGLAELYARQKRYALAEEMFLRALAIVEEHGGKDDPRAEELREGLARVYRATGRPGKARSILKGQRNQEGK